MQNSDEYLQHPGIGTIGKEGGNTQANPASLIILKFSPNKLVWLSLPSNGPTVGFCLGTWEVELSFLLRM